MSYQRVGPYNVSQCPADNGWLIVRSIRGKLTAKIEEKMNETYTGFVGKNIVDYEFIIEHEKQFKFFARPEYTL